MNTCTAFLWGKENSVTMRDFSKVIIKRVCPRVKVTLGDLWLTTYRVLLHHDVRLVVQKQGYHLGMVILCGIM